MRLVILSVLYTAMILFQGGFAWSATDTEKTVRLAVLPLDIVKTGPYSYLGTSIGQMLITRCSSLENVDVVSTNTSGTALDNLRLALKAGNVQSVAQELGADWVADGSVYSLVDGIKMNLTLYPGTEGVEPALFGFTAEKPEDILPAITGLTADIGRILTGAGEKQADGKEGTVKDDGMSAFRTPHPELAYKKGLYSAGGLTSGEEERFSTTRILRSSSIPIATESMVFADLDGNGTNDLIVASQREIRVFNFTDYRFDEVAAYAFSLNTKIHALSVLPGRQGRHSRLLVSADGDKLPASAVLSWDGSKTLQLEKESIDWYIRAVLMPGEGYFIAGQRLDPNTDAWILDRGVYRLLLDQQTSRPISGNRLVLPEQTKLFDFVYADINGDNLVETIVIDDRQKLLVYNANNELVWVSSASYGGGLSFYGQPVSAVQADEPKDERILQYLPGRLEVKDIDQNGTPEIIVNTNTVSSLISYFPNLKSFDGGSVACLAWNDGSLIELWRTNRITGYVADYAFEAAVKGDTSPENEVGRLYVAQSQGKSLLQKFLPGSETTKILMYEMLISPPKGQ